jgi:hypothetical protein
MENTYKSILDEILKNNPEGGASETEDQPKPNSSENAPVDPTPVDPAPVDPSPVDPAPVDPAPADPAPTDPATKEWYEEEESPKPSDTTNDTPNPTPASEPKTEEEEDEDIKLIKDYKKQGKSLKDFVKEYNVVDYNSMDDKKIIELGLKELEGFSGEELEDAQNEIESMSLFQRKKLIQEYRGKFDQVNQEKLKQLNSVNTTQKEQTDRMMQRFNTELEETVKTIENQERYGIKVTDEMSKSLRKYVAEEMSFQRPDGSLDVEALLDVAIWRKYGRDIVRANVTKAKNEGREEILRQTTNPSTGMNPSNSSAGLSGNGVEDAYSQYLKSKR